MLFVVDASGVARPVPLHPNSPYAKVADLVSLAARGDEVVALGDGTWRGPRELPLDRLGWLRCSALMSIRRHSRPSAAQSAGGLLDIVIHLQGPRNRRHAGLLRKAVWTLQYGCPAGERGSAQSRLAVRSPTPEDPGRTPRG